MEPPKRKPGRPKGSGKLTTGIMVRASETELRLLRVLAKMAGKQPSAYLRWLIREEAKRQGVPVGNGNGKENGEPKK